MGIKFKKVSQSDDACVYGLVEDISSVDYKQMCDWLDTHFPGEFLVSNMHVIIKRQNELFFELTFPTI